MNFAAFKKEYLVTLKTCQFADWRACTALICKHAEQASHQVEDGLKSMLATEVCLSSTHVVVKTIFRVQGKPDGNIAWAWGANASIPATGTPTMPRPNAWLVMKSVPNPARMAVQREGTILVLPKL